MKSICRVAFNELIEEDCLVLGNLHLKKNDWCVTRFKFYEDYGRIHKTRPLPQDISPQKLKNLPKIKRQATLVDQGKANENKVRSKSFQKKATKQILSRKLSMRLIGTHYTFDRRLVIFSFTGPNRVDFRELIKDLSDILHLRVEFRYLDPREYAQKIGGVDTCGRSLCCSTFLTNFVNINKKMAIVQNISLNPSSIFGVCGRLKCCLSYEYEGYKTLIKAMPKPGTACQCDGCDGEIIGGNPLTNMVKVALDGGKRVVTVPVSQVYTSN